MARTKQTAHATGSSILQLKAARSVLAKTYRVEMKDRDGFWRAPAKNLTAHEAAKQAVAAAKRGDVAYVRERREAANGSWSDGPLLMDCAPWEMRRGRHAGQIRIKCAVTPGPFARVLKSKAIKKALKAAKKAR